MIHSNTAFDIKSVVPKIAAQVSEWEPEEWVRNEIMIMNNFLARIGARQIIDDQQRIGLRYDLILPMRSHYRDEDIYYSNTIDRLNKYQVFPYNGKLYDSKGEPINTKPMDFNTGAILVMTREGALFLSHKERGVIHHSTLLASAEVAYACMLEVSNGEIIREEVWSGHYEPTQKHQAQFHDRLNKNCCLEIPQNLTAVFLIKSWFEQDRDRLCALSRLPLLEPVKLPCGHTFNLSAISTWYKTRKLCPIDNKKFEMDKISFDDDAFSSSKRDYKTNLSKKKSYIAELDAKVIQLKLDDRNENLATVSTHLNEVGVLLFLKEDSTVKRIYEIGKTIGFIKESQCSTQFIVNGRNIDYEKQISEIKNRCAWIPRIVLA